RLLELVGNAVAEDIRTAFTVHPFEAEDFEDSVAAIEPLGDDEVFDLEEPVSHSFVGNSLIMHNCGEQPLLPYESCNLASIDLARHMKRTAGSRWDFACKNLDGTLRPTFRML